MKFQMNKRRRQMFMVAFIALAIAALTVATAVAQAPVFTFNMVRSSGAEAANCLPYASGTVNVTELGPVEVLDLAVTGLAPNTTYSFFVLQVPDAPFGIGWYNGEIETDATGYGTQQFIGRFNDETFALAPGVAPAPVVHTETPFPDAAENPQFAPVHTFHLGLWFSDPQDAANAGCPNAVTPFDGDHVAGIQILSTRNFPPEAGPLQQVAPAP